jgi:hypothetical protein
MINRILRFCLLLACGSTLCISCNTSADQKLKFDPVIHKAYHFSLTKYFSKSWTYQSVPVRINDTVSFKFSLENMNSANTLNTCKLTLYGFTMDGKFHIDYHRDSLHALSTYVFINDSGKVKFIQDVNAMITDIKNDSATGKYLSDIIPDYISNSALTDMFTRIFSIIPDKKVKPDDIWVTDITLITNHPLNFSNFLVLQSRNKDSAMIKITSNVFARLSQGYDFYIKGNQSGEALMNYQTGMPYWYKTETTTITNTNFYDINEVQKFILTQEEK